MYCLVVTDWSISKGELQSTLVTVSTFDSSHLNQDKTLRWLCWVYWEVFQKGCLYTWSPTLLWNFGEKIQLRKNLPFLIYLYLPNNHQFKPGKRQRLVLLEFGKISLWACGFCRPESPSPKDFSPQRKACYSSVGQFGNLGHSKTLCTHTMANTNMISNGTGNRLFLENDLKWLESAHTFFMVGIFLF